MDDDAELKEGEAFGDPDVALSYIDEKLQDVLGHFQKDFEGRLSPENLGSKFGGYGSFLPMYQHSQEVPEVMSPELLRTITNNFSEEQKLCVGTFGTVYKGLHRGKEIAVKWLHLMSQQLDYEKEFMKEFKNLRRLKHPNIVQLLGYCYEIKRVCVEHEGRYVMADDIHRALCFEYMCKGSLQRHLDDEVHRLDWWACYKIIKGTCKGLKYLHEAKIYHLDLKPGNILLDMNMVPKIADFGLSRVVRDNETHATSSLLGTNRYCPPEYIDHRYISNKFDIFSLGVVMIEIIAGREGYCKAAEIPSQEFIDHVRQWRSQEKIIGGASSNKKINQNTYIRNHATFTYYDHTKL